MLPINIPQAEIEQSLILKCIQDGSDKPTVFLPNYGEFGSTIHKSIKIVYFFDCPKKIVCCKRGEEAYFPNADEFFYDWEDFVDEKHKWGFFTKRNLTGIGKNHQYRSYKQKLAADADCIMEKLGGDYNYIHLWKFRYAPIFDQYNRQFIFDLKPIEEKNIFADVIISPRNRSSREENNFYKWDKIIKVLNKKGYSVGCVGTKAQSLHLERSEVNSWDYPDNSSAVIELLANCKLYLGLDTGVSHLASFMSVPMIVFSHSNQKHYFTSFMKDMNRNYFLDLGKRVKNTSEIIENVLKFLEGK